MSKKFIKIGLIALGSILFLFLVYVGYVYYIFNNGLFPNEGKFEHSAHYIDPDEALLNDGFTTCNDYIYQYYNDGELPYEPNKKHFRDYIVSNYKNKNYTDSGYLNIRFIINCEGKAGRFVIHENNLDLEPHQFNKELKNQLFKLTSEVAAWKPVFLYDKDRDAYVYVSYRIEHGEITEIIP